MATRERCEPQTTAEARAAAALTEGLRDEFPRGIAQPALRALANARLTSLQRLTLVTERELLAMHGMGPKALRLLRDAMQLRGLRFKTTTDAA
jgi:hypothetical protein